MVEDPFSIFEKCKPFKQKYGQKSLLKASIVASTINYYLSAFWEVLLLYILFRITVLLGVLDSYAWQGSPKQSHL